MSEISTASMANLQRMLELSIIVTPQPIRAFLRFADDPTLPQRQ